MSRRATHAGSWYLNSNRDLNKQLDNWLNAAELTHGPARAIIAPHAGYQYCGACSAFAYRQISPVVVQRIFILGPSHHVRLTGCALSTVQKYRTPLYDLQIDSQENLKIAVEEAGDKCYVKQPFECHLQLMIEEYIEPYLNEHLEDYLKHQNHSVYAELEATGQFERMSIDVDEDEHSIEMHLPYIAKVMQDYKDSFTIVPVLVGSLSSDREALYGRIFARYLADPQNLFIISSDFCHWGQRFRYTYYDNSWGDIYESITKLDKTAMDIIETLNPASFTEYLKKYANTICGRHPIGVLLQAASFLQKAGTNGHKMSMKFLKYAQSSQCMSVNDSSVSYAAASLTFE